MSKQKLSFSSKTLNSLFPFYILLDNDLTIVESGRSMLKMLPNIVSKSFTEVFRVKAGSKLLEKNEIIQNEQTTIFIECYNASKEFICFKGQLEYCEENDFILFAGSPWLDSISQVNSLHLESSDFANHNSLLDFLNVIASKESYIENIQDLVAALNTKKNELKKLSYIAEEATTSALITNSNGEIEWINKYYERITGYSANETIGKRIGDFLHGPETEIKTLEYITSQIKNALPFSCEILLYNKSSKPFWAKINGQPIFNQEGDLINCFAITEDISESKKLEINLTTTALRLSTLISNLNSGILIETENGDVLLTNQKFCELFNISAPASQLSGQNNSFTNDYLKHFFTDIEAFESGIKGILEKKTVVQKELLTLKDGRSFERDFAPIWNQGSYLGHMWVFNDVTDRKLYDKQLKEQREFYERILNNIPADIAVYDNEGRYKFINPIRLQNKEQREWAIGKTDTELSEYIYQNPQIVEEKNIIIEKVFKSKREESWQEQRTAFDKNFEHYLHRINPILDQDQKIEMLFSYGMNITEQKKVEEELQKSKIEIEAAANSKTQFLANMSHEIRTPMNGIICIASLLAKTSLDPQQKEFLNIIIESADNLFSIVNSILDLEKISAGKLNIEEIPFNISERINRAVDLFRFKAEEKDILLLLENKLPEDLILAGDPYRLSQILNNLIDNAIKFTDKGFVKVSSEIASTKENSLELVFRVKDSGIGIQQENLSLIFTPFEQAEKNTSRKFGGTGLGLSISKNLIEMQGGTIITNSKPDLGTEFIFTIPYKVATDHFLSKIELDINQNKNIKLDNFRFLIAEDIHVNQYLLQHIIKSWGATAVIVDNGEKAIETFQENDFDLILMDIQMPVMDGIEATKFIRTLENPIKSQVPILALTANALRGDNEKYLELGMSAYLSKPFNESSLLNVITDLLKVSEKAINTHEKPVFSSTKSTSIDKESELFDLEKLYHLSSGDDHFVQNMIHLFMTSVPPIIEDANIALSNKNYQQLAKVAHKLKPMIDTLSITPLKPIVRSIEDAASSELNLEYLPDQLTELTATLTACIGKMKSTFN